MYEPLRIKFSSYKVILKVERNNFLLLLIENRIQMTRNPKKTSQKTGTVKIHTSAVNRWLEAVDSRSEECDEWVPVGLWEPAPSCNKTNAYIILGHLCLWFSCSEPSQTFSWHAPKNKFVFDHHSLVKRNSNEIVLATSNETETKK